MKIYKLFFLIIIIILLLAYVFFPTDILIFTDTFY